MNPRISRSLRIPKSTSQTRETLGDSRVLADLRKAFANESLSKALAMSVQMLRESSDHFHWVGIYLVRGKDLVLEAYAGDEETEHVRIPIGQGICGSAAKEGETIVVPDVNKDPRYLMCFASTRSGIVVPIKGRNGVLGEIDIDSSRLSPFSLEDRETLEGAALILPRYLDDRPFESHDPSTS